jgi:Tyrosine phosphatase family
MFAAVASLLFGCGFKETLVEGVPNLAQAFPGNTRVWRMGQPVDDVAWAYVVSEVSPGQVTRPTRTLVIKLNDDVEGDDEPVNGYYGWHVVKVSLMPEEDKPWSVLQLPRASDVVKALQLADEAYRQGQVVIFHCTHGRDRTGLLVGLFGMRLLGWSKKQAWDDMVSHGFRWELPDLDLFFAAWP